MRASTSYHRAFQMFGESLMMATIETEKVLAMLTQLLEQAHEVEADVGTAPTAQEALEWAISEVRAMAGGPSATEPG